MKLAKKHVLTFFPLLGSPVRQHRLDDFELVVQGWYKIFAKTVIQSYAVHQAYEQQKETDATVLALFRQMADLYSFVDDVGSLPEKIKRLEAVITRVLEQTTECGIFFREYTSKGFLSEYPSEPAHSTFSMCRIRSICRTGYFKSQPDDIRSILDTGSTTE